MFSVSGPIQGATIRIKNSLIEAQSDFDGYFNIDAQVGDILIVNYLGMTEKQTVVEDFDDLYVLLKTEAQILDEVVLSSTNKNKDNLVDTGYGRKNKDAVGFSNSTITKKDISPGATSLADVIRGKFAGVWIECYDTPRITIRVGTGSMNTPAYASYDVDGLIFEDFPTFINAQQIESITILKSYGATNRYGSIGRGGVFVIRMNNFYKGSSQTLDSALIKGNDYEEELGMISFEKNSKYIEELEEAFSFENAKEIYDLIVDTGKDFRLTHCGSHAMDTMRMESGFLHWGHDISPEENQYQAGLNFAISYKKPFDFIGKENLLKIRDQKLDRRFVMLVLKKSKSGEPLLLHEEPIYLDDKIIGKTTSGNYSFNYNKNLSFGYINCDFSNEQLVDKNLYIEIEKKKYSAELLTKPLKANNFKNL